MEHNPFSFCPNLLDFLKEFRLPKLQSQAAESSLSLLKGALIHWDGVLKYTSEFMDPSWDALSAFYNTEREKIKRTWPAETIRDYAGISQFNVNLGLKALTTSLTQMSDYYLEQIKGAFASVDRKSVV